MLNENEILILDKNGKDVTSKEGYFCFSSYNTV